MPKTTNWSKPGFGCAGPIPPKHSEHDFVGNIFAEITACIPQKGNYTYAALEGIPVANLIGVQKCLAIFVS